MFKKFIKFKGYAFIGTLITAGVIVGITYNIIQANNNKSINATYENAETNQGEENTEKYDQLQKQIDELRLQLEDTQLELVNVKEDLLTEKDKIDSLNTQISSLKKLNKNNVTTTTYNYNNQELIEHLEEVSAKNSEQQNLWQEKSSVENELNRLKQKLEYYNSLTVEREGINYKITTTNAQIKSLEAETIKPNPNLEKIEELEKEIAFLTSQLESLDTKIENAKLTAEENRRFSELTTKLAQIKEKLLQY